MSKASDATAPSGPAHDVASNTTDNAKDTAPPVVSSNPSAETRECGGTSTREGPSHPKVHVPSDTGGKDHVKQGAKGGHEIPAPGSRVDDEHDGHGDKTMKRQE